MEQEREDPDAGGAGAEKTQSNSNNADNSPETPPKASRKITPQMRWNRAHPLEIWCHNALRSALKRGLIARDRCEICGAEQADGHHGDHREPLNVRWLCRRHHRRLHLARRAAR